MAIKTDLNGCSIEYLEELAKYEDIVVEDGVAYLILEDECRP